MCPDDAPGISAEELKIIVEVLERVDDALKHASSADEPGLPSHDNLLRVIEVADCITVVTDRWRMEVHDAIAEAMCRACRGLRPDLEWSRKDTGFPDVEGRREPDGNVVVSIEVAASRVGGQKGRQRQLAKVDNDIKRLQDKAKDAQVKITVVRNDEMLKRAQRSGEAAGVRVVDARQSLECQLRAILLEALPAQVEKAFDCVEFQHRAGAAVAKRLAGMTIEEKVAYFAKGTEELRKRQQELRRKAGAA
jgi:hypothetical protein